MNTLRDAVTALRHRVGRLRPDLIPAPYRGWVIGSWVLTAALAVAILIPAFTAGITAEQAGGSGLIGSFAAPLPTRLLLLGAAAVLAGTLLAVALLREREQPARRHRIARETLLALVGSFPVLALAADRHWVQAAAALVILGLAEIVTHRPAVATPGGTVLSAALAAATWIPLLIVQVRIADDDASSWAWLALFGFAAVFAAFGAYYGVARAAESRTQVLRPLFRDDLAPLFVLGIVALATAVVVLRLTVARELFPEPDPTLWQPFAEAPVSWGHAAFVAALVVVVAARSVRRPLRRSGEGGVTAALALAGNAQLALAVAVIVAGMLVAVVSDTTLLPEPAPVVVAALKFGGTVAILAAVLMPPFRGTAARALGLITAAYLVPLTLVGLLGAMGIGLPAPLAGFPASPVQVAVLLVAVAVVAALAGLLGPRGRPFGTGLVVRLAVVPVVAVHAGWLLPAAWTELGRVVLVVGVLLALLLLLPVRASDPTRHAFDVLNASAGQLLALTVFALALPSFVRDAELVVLGLFWLAVAVIAALTIRTGDVPAPADATHSAHAGLR